MITYHNLLRHFARNLREVLTEVWKDKKTKENMKKNLFEIISKELYKLPKWRTHEICSRFYWGLDVIPKTYDEICVSVSLNKYIITFYLIPLLYQIRSCCWKYRKWGSHLRNCYHFAKVVENERVDFSISPYCTLLFSRKENFNFFDLALTTVLRSGVVRYIMNVWEYQHWNTSDTTSDI